MPGIGLLLLAVLLTSLLGVGCAVVEKDRRALALQAATNGYQSALRWGYYETALGFLHPDQRKSGELPEAFAQLRVTGYDVTQPPVVQPDDSATQVVVIDYLFEDTQVVKHLTDRQVWRWDASTNTWWLDSGLPRFTPVGTVRVTRQHAP
jgi:type II secretory pathway pseudopilin PulG